MIKNFLKIKNLKDLKSILKKVISTYEEGKGAMPTIDEDLLNLIKVPQLRHRIELQNGTVVNGEIIEEDQLGVIIQTSIGQLAIEKDTFFASSSVLQFLTFIVTNFVAPSPSAATRFAKFKRTLNKEELKSDNFLSFTLVKFEFWTSPVAKIETISLVLVSPSQEIALKVFCIFFLSSCFKILEDILASVKTNPNVVAIFGKIIPDPFAIP